MMQRAGRIMSGVLGGLVFVGAAGGTFWWLQSRSATRESAPEVPVTQSPGTTAPPAQGSAPQSPPLSGVSAWAPVALPAGSVKIERGGSAAAMTEPGIVRFELQSGESTTWHWSRTLAQRGATPVGDWAAVNGEGKSEEGLLVQLSTGDAYRFKGRLLWLGKEGALFLVKESGRQRLILTDALWKPQSERWLPDEFANSFDWQREESGWFRFLMRTAKGSDQYQRFSIFTGALEAAGPPAKQGLWLEQTTLFPGGCGGDGGGNLVKLHQGNQVLWSVLDAIAPQISLYTGSRVLADGSGALIETIDGPTVLRTADGRLQPAPELKALDSHYLYTSPTSPVEVAAAPKTQQDGSILLQTARIGQAATNRTFSLRATKSDKNVDITIDSGAYWSPDGRFLQLAVNYPEAGGRCVGGDDESLFLAPVVVKGEWKAPLQVRVKKPISLYRAEERSGSWIMGAPQRTVAAGERFTVKGASAYPKPFLVVEGGILLSDPSQLEWVP